MRWLNRSRKKEEKTPAETPKVTSELEQICGSDHETYESLYHTMYLDPKNVETSSKEAAEKAKTYEKEKDLAKARIWYDIAGGMAIYEGNTKKVVEFFSESERISGMKYTILSKAEKAVAKAQEYYKKYLKK